MAADNKEQMITMRKTRVLILSEGFGSGHTQAGYALAAGLKKMDRNIRTKVMELGSFLNPTAAPLILSAYRTAVNTSPALVGMMYRMKSEKPVGRFSWMALHTMFYHQTAQIIEQLQPDLIICTHPIPSAIISRLKRSGMDIPLYTVITDYDAHSSWITPGVDHYLVSAPEVRALLIERGIKPEAVQATGIPVHPDFWNVRDKQTVRKELAIKDMPTVFVMGGGWGLLFKEDFIARFAAWKERVQIVCCVGSNAKLAAKLRNDPRFDHPNIIVLGYTREISKWMDAADLLITKPGGMTCTEGLVKGLPMLFFESLPGQETKNCEYFVKSGYGEVLASGDALDIWFHRVAGESAGSSGCGKVKRLNPQPVYKPERCAQTVMQLLQPASGSVPDHEQMKEPRLAGQMAN